MRLHVPILLYQNISSSGPFLKTSLHPELFAAHLAFLHANGYTPVTVSQLAQAMIDYTVRLPHRPIVLTFDNGLSDFYSEALPVLRKFEFPATVYISTSSVGRSGRWGRREKELNDHTLTWEEIGRLCLNGIECGAHGHRQIRLDSLSRRGAWDEITHSKMEFQRHLGRSVSTFAYPDGYASNRSRQLVQEAGFTSACTARRGSNRDLNDRFSLARIPVANGTDVRALKCLLLDQKLSDSPDRARSVRATHPAVSDRPSLDRVDR